MSNTFETLKLQRRIFLALNVIAAFTMAILFYLIIHQQNEISHATDRIQAERYNSIIRSCKDQNNRHDNTIQILDNLIARLPKNQQSNAKASKHFTVLLINALAPHQKCGILANKSVPSEQ